MTAPPVLPAGLAQPRRPLNAREVAALLRRTCGWLYDNHARLTADHGFPPPLPGLGLMWDPAAIAAWQTASWPEELRRSAGADAAAPAGREGAAARPNWAALRETRA